MIIWRANRVQYRQMVDEVGEIAQIDASSQTSFLSLSRRLRNFAAQLAPAMLCGHYCLRESARRSSRGSTLANLIRSMQAIDAYVCTYKLNAVVVEISELHPALHRTRRTPLHPFPPLDILFQGSKTTQFQHLRRDAWFLHFAVSHKAAACEPSRWLSIGIGRFFL